MVLSAIILGLVAGTTCVGCGSSPDAPQSSQHKPSTHSTTAGDTWHTSYDTAIAEAEARDLPLLIDFSGLDWCEPCRALRTDVFESKDFGDWAHKRCILLEIDVPAPSKPRDVATVELLDKYDVKTFPTVLFVKPTGEVIDRIPVSFNEPETWLEAANTILAD